MLIQNDLQELIKWAKERIAEGLETPKGILGELNLERNTYYEGVIYHLQKAQESQPAKPESETLQKLQAEILARPRKLFGQGEVVFIAFSEYVSEDSNETDWFIFEAIVESKHCETYCVQYFDKKTIRWEYEENQLFRTRAEAEAYAQKLKGGANV